VQDLIDAIYAHEDRKHKLNGPQISDYPPSFRHLTAREETVVRRQGKSVQLKTEPQT